jgi:hypothetical protein
VLALCLSLRLLWLIDRSDLDSKLAADHPFAFQKGTYACRHRLESGTNDSPYASTFMKLCRSRIWVSVYSIADYHSHIQVLRYCSSGHYSRHHACTSSIYRELHYDHAVVNKKQPSSPLQCFEPRVSFVGGRCPEDSRVGRCCD